MSINDKIKQILLEQNFSPSYFADEIGVQRSSISHILSGRNRPSFDIIQKIIRRFPELGYDWIMEDDSPEPAQRQAPPNSRGVRTTLAQPSTERGTTNPTGYVANTSLRSQRTEIPAVQSAATETLQTPATTNDLSLPGPAITTSVERKVERILIFYTDGSFREYTPAD